MPALAETLAAEGAEEDSSLGGSPCRLLIMFVRRPPLGAKAPQSAGAHAINVSYTTQDPFSGFTRFLRSDLAAPNGVNWGVYNDPEMDKLLKNASASFDPKERDKWLA